MILQEQSGLNFFGIDWDGPIPEAEDEDNAVDVPDVENPLRNQDFQHLQATVPPTVHSDYFGVDIYLEVIEFLNNH